MKQNQPQSSDAPSAGRLTPGERRAAGALACIFGLRMLGLFLLLPVFAVHADRYHGYTAVLAGVALGAYGLTQAMLQIPFGILSDRIGRKPVILAGLLLFAAGSAVAALSDSIYGVIVGRALQGAGAIAAAVLALTADLTREQHRTKAMAVIGASIGLAFAVGFVAAPLITARVGLAGLFWLTALLALLGAAVLMLYVPTPAASRLHRDAEPVPGQILNILRDAQLLRLDFGIMALHLMLTASFVVVPLVLRDAGGLPPAQHWKVYVLVLGVSVPVMAPFVVIADRYRLTKPIFVGAVAALALAQGGLFAWHASLFETVLFLLVFFIGFNILEATLPSLISTLAPPAQKGTALGVYSTSQFLGAFLGGAAGGWLHGRFGPEAVFAFCALLAAVWGGIAVTMRRPRALASRLVRLGAVHADQADELARGLTAISGVTEAVVVPEDGIAYLKVDRSRLDEQALRAFEARAFSEAKA
ncbi:MAG: MFS transporter [Gammaproteobacteria bacterium]|nr:MFS transporter [Gammaproteobacteria bacterium]NIR82569.1 MFS transporter [Gammaproteobacteria bacterium]NIR88772.1 MFS transporter [Gammaproteobacteria bacterium]NIV73977.1 MFS transporter [Gammaproteobacteria bacterium]